MPNDRWLTASDEVHPGAPIFDELELTFEASVNDEDGEVVLRAETGLPIQRIALVSPVGRVLGMLDATSTGVGLSEVRWESGEPSVAEVREAFPEVVVRTGLAAFHHLRRGIARRQHQDRRVVARLTHLAQHAEAVDPEQHHVQDHEVERMASDERRSLFTVPAESTLNPSRARPRSRVERGRSESSTSSSLTGASCPGGAALACGRHAGVIWGGHDGVQAWR